MTIFVYTNLSFFMCLSDTIFFFSFLSLYALFYCHIVVISRILGALWETWEVYKISFRLVSYTYQALDDADWMATVAYYFVTIFYADETIFDLGN